MTMAPITIANPMDAPLTASYLSARGRSPLYIGTLWKVRWQVRDENDAAVALTGATVVMAITRNGVTIERKTGVTSAGAPAEQIVFDADQTAEIADPINGIYTGKGWMEARCDAVASDIAALTTVRGKSGRHEVGIKFGDETTQVVFVEGDIDVLQPKNTFPIP